MPSLVWLAYGIATLSVAGLAWISRSPYRFNLLAVSAMLATTWALSNLSSVFAVGDGKFFPTMDGLCCAVCAMVWVRERGLWLLAVAALFAAMTVRHAMYFSGADFGPSARYSYDLSLNIMYAAQLMVVAIESRASWLRARWKRLLTGVVALICSASLGHAAVASQCYVASDLSSVTPSGIRVAQPSACAPIDNSTTYKYYPLTQGAAFDMTPELTSTTTQCQAIASLWANRWDGGPTTHKPNPPAGPEVDVNDGVHGLHPCNLDYTSLAIAEAVDKSEAYWLYGYASHFTNSRGWLDASEAVSIPDANNMTFADFQTNAATLCPNWDATDNLYYAQNIVVRPNVRLPDLPANLQAWGIKYDYEPHDGRSTTDTKSLVTSIVNAGVRFSYLVSFYVNPLDGPETPNSGVDSTDVDTIANKVAVFELIVSHNPNGGMTMAQSLANQLAMFANPPNLAKFNYVIDPAMTPTQAHTMRLLVVSEGFGGFDDWPDGQAAGGVCTSNYNQILSIMYGIMS